MKRSSLALAALVLAAGLSSFVGASASHCWPNSNPTQAQKDRTADDAFGSCEQMNGTTKCGAGTTVQGVGVVIVDANKGAQLCSDNASGPSFPAHGRITVHKASNNKVTVASDGDDTYNEPSNVKSWSRVDVDPNASSNRACIRRGSGGTYWTANGGTSTPDAMNQCGA